MHTVHIKIYKYDIHILPGVGAVEEMHEKFSNQKSNRNQLETEVKDAR